MKRGAQIIYPKDVSSILLDGDIWNGAVVLEIGSGSGALTLALVLSVGESGYVFSVDNNQKNQYRASKTIERFLQHKEIINRNYEFINIEAEDVDISKFNKNISHIITDIPEPWSVVGKFDIKTNIKWISYLPNISQVQLINESLIEYGYTNIYIKEIIEREWRVKGKVVRPEHNLKGHTGFLVFADYERPALRLGAIQKVRVIHEFTHDSFFVGEDGPTHQPIEHAMALRTIPDLNVFRPADAKETAVCFRLAMENKNSPSALLLTRQGVPVLDQDYKDLEANVRKGAYIVKDCDNSPELIFIATGSEVSLAIDTAELMSDKKIRIISMPCMEIFNKHRGDAIIFTAGTAGYKTWPGISNNQSRDN